MCSPPALGDPCQGGGLAHPGNLEPMPGLGISNPVHLASGNKFQLEVDLPPNPAAPGLELIRHYNSLSRLSGALGSNWAFSYDVQLQQRVGVWYARQSDGSQQRAEHVTRRGDGFLWRWQNGRELRFDAMGRLIGIRDGGRKWLDIYRHEAPHVLAGKIDRIQSRNGHTLQFEYAEIQGQTIVTAVKTPLGSFRYDYELPPADSGHRSVRLAAVLRPDGMRRLYHYEPTAQRGNPYALTGISLQPPGGPPRRLTSWAYDRYSRVVAIRHHDRALPSLAITYHRAATAGLTGITRVSNSRGLQRDFEFERAANGSYRLLGPELEYDHAGRLERAGNTRLTRTPDGDLQGVFVQHSGWPGLRMDYQRPIRQLSWYTHTTGVTQQQVDTKGRPARLQYANGDTIVVTYDAQNRPTRIVAASRGSGKQHVTRLQWHGKRLRHIEHPYERENRRLGDRGDVLERRIERPSLLGAPAFRFREAFHYDADGRLIRHELPEGGALVHTWASGPRSWPRLLRLVWEDAQGRHRVVVDANRYGNGLELLTAARSGPHADTLVLRHGDTLLWQQTRSYDDAGRVMLDRHDYPSVFAVPANEHMRFAYDDQSRMTAVRHQYASGSGAQGPMDAYIGNGTTAPRPAAPLSRSEDWWFAWQDDGRLAAHRINDVTHTRQAGYDAAGMPRRFGSHGLHYGPGRRLEKVTTGGNAKRTLAEYRHNVFGHRIAKKVGDEVVHFLYWHDRLVAEAATEGPDTSPRVTRRYLHVGSTPVGMIEYSRSGRARLYFVHADLSGAPRMLTDEGGRMRWLATYTPLGQARQWAGDLHFPLRLPGQYEDRETGWHDNLLRTYVPSAGHYLEPDPLGPLPDTDAYGYAAQQPWRYADPAGLLLFAFDGTRYSSDTRGNVWRLAQGYGGTAYYHSGPGNSSFLDWDAVVAWQAGRILENQWQSLLTSLERQPSGIIMPIDIVGFSRGAALARHFANRIASHTRNGLFTVEDAIRGQVSACVDLRFMGLFDTVAQFGIGGSHNYLYDFGINAMWSWVSHAVALHEHRWTFPLTSARQGDAENVVEAPFVGAHADIGGGLALYDSETAGIDEDVQSNDLAKIALQWMHWQALAATAEFNDLSATDTTVEAPKLRDMRAPLWRTIQRGDRAVTDPEGRPWLAYQSDHAGLGAAQRAHVEAFIERLPDWRSRSGDIVGAVDMNGYAEWLQETLGWVPN